MKSLVFNLLHQGAMEAGCAAEAWEIVAEFAATEAMLAKAGGVVGATDVALPPGVVLAAEALLQCLCGDGSGDVPVVGSPEHPSIIPSDD